MKFHFVMQHTPTQEQLAVAGQVGRIVQLDNKSLLNVPDDPALPREWFVARAEEIEAAVGNFSSGDTVQVMGQQQLAMAVSARAKRAGCHLVESVTRRESVDRPQADGSVKKESVFVFNGFRTVHEY